MFCCSSCFKNQEVRSTIEEIAQTSGECNYCGTKGVKLVDAREIVELFQPVLNLYEVSPQGNKMLHDVIQEEWDIFNLTSDIINLLLIDIFSDVKSISSDLFNHPVINRTHNHVTTEGLINQWESLKKEIVEKNRFFLESVIELELLEKYLRDKSKTYKKGDLFYRGRISKKEGFLLEELGKPLAEKASGGRANPQGIPYLYVSTDKETTLYETRATYLDYVTIGTFRLTEDISVVKLRTVEILSPFEENIFDKLLYQPFLKGLEDELSKPLRRFDSDLDYLPTQYLCEFIKHMGFEGVEYGSAMKKDGINLAIFDDSKFECIEKSVVEVNNIEISFQEGDDKS
ncbi:MAG: RES family NAD+ phosphorylase [Bacteroidales bacterium]|nr:RES family NAD+ phosphorylase [Bacteroidales bacterium]